MDEIVEQKLRDEECKEVHPTQSLPTQGLNGTTGFAEEMLKVAELNVELKTLYKFKLPYTVSYFGLKIVE